MMMSQDVSRTHVQTHSGGQDNFVVIIIAPQVLGTITSADGHISALHAVSV